ncbi:MAG: MBL fold metallo-hydrolase, partial [Thermoguttaceae bacterium]|nr:MBL fold metallo-hydrolase [Thermoguttaceae bacterium]
FAEQKLRVEPTNVGGAVYVPISPDANVPKAQILTVAAPHSSTCPNGAPGGTSLGFVLSFSQNGKPLDPNAVDAIKPLRKTLADADAFSIYFACDSGFFGDMSWIGSLGIDVAVLPIGDRYTMGPAASLDAIRALKPKYVVPSHYNTWPPIAQNVERWSAAVVDWASPTKPLVAKIGAALESNENGDWR